MGQGQPSTLDKTTLRSWELEWEGRGKLMLSPPRMKH